ncbi:MAG: GCN5-related N-acetyltransferase [Segetibacter sp.]|nr:GCN5-related N-acetyltransferase [Segetibacter sp.]
MQAINTLKIKVDDTVLLETLDDKHAEQILNLVNNNRQHLRKWLPWVDYMHSLIDFKNFIINSRKRQMAGGELSFAIFFNETFAGRIGLYNIDVNNKTASIGYWLGESFEGNGIVSKACKELVAYGFTFLALNRIEIRCGTKNYKSQSIAEILNFKKEGIIRQGEFVNNNFIDLYSYSVVKQEWTDLSKQSHIER